MFLALVSLIALTGITGAILATGAANKKELDTSIDRARALYVAESALNRAIANLNSGVAVADLVMGIEDAKFDLAGGTSWGSAVDNGDSTVTLRAEAQVGVVRRAVEVLLEEDGVGIFGHAVFSGNSDNDPTYALELGGFGAQADQVNGDVYSGGGVQVSGDARVSGVIRSLGSAYHSDSSSDVSDHAGEVTMGISQPTPDLSGMDYATIADVDVSSEFSSSASYAWDDAGGDAWQLPESNPAHIFRLNPSNRSTEVNSTTKDDYFLEDPYTSVSADWDKDGSGAFGVSLSDGANGGVDGNDKIYYIDGNLWIHNYSTFSLQLKSADGADVSTTFVVQGNIYLSDNLFYEDNARDSVAFIAMKDDAVSDSGNIYFGDPEFGTLQTLESFMYAENNFHDNNLDANGSATVVLNGNMTAGNKVIIDRDYGDQHSKLTVNYDDRIMTGVVTPPGLPQASGASRKHYSVRLWREVASLH